MQISLPEGTDILVTKMRPGETLVSQAVLAQICSQESPEEENATSSEVTRFMINVMTPPEVPVRSANIQKSTASLWKYFATNWYETLAS